MSIGRSKISLNMAAAKVPGALEQLRGTPSPRNGDRTERGTRTAHDYRPGPRHLQDRDDARESDRELAW